MRVNYGPIVTEAHGRLGQVIFTTYYEQGAARLFRVSRNPNSQGQAVQRTTFHNAAYTWTGLPQSFKRHWDNYINGDPPRSRVKVMANFIDHAITDGGLDTDPDLFMPTEVRAGSLTFTQNDVPPGSISYTINTINTGTEADIIFNRCGIYAWAPNTANAALDVRNQRLTREEAQFHIAELETETPGTTLTISGLLNNQYYRTGLYLFLYDTTFEDEYGSYYDAGVIQA